MEQANKETSWNSSNINMVRKDKNQQEINKLKEKIKFVKQFKKQQYDSKTDIYKSSTNSKLA